MLSNSLNSFVEKCFKGMKINYVDVGSSLPLNRVALFFKKQFNFIFFEPNFKEFLVLKKFLQKHFVSFKVFNSAISDMNKVNFYIYNRYKLSSIHKLDHKYKDIYRKIKLNKKQKFKCIKLQEVIKKKNNRDVFFLKVDTQGHSLQVIRSAKKRINCLACLIVEVEKIPAYKNSFSSSDIDLFLKKNNFFELGCINDYRWSRNFKNKKYRYFGKELSHTEDRIYIKNIFTTSVNKFDLKLIILICIIFDYLDFAAFLIEKFHKKFEKNFITLTKKEISNKLILNEKFIRSNLQLFYKKKISISYLLQILDNFSEFFSKKYVF